VVSHEEAFGGRGLLTALWSARYDPCIEAAYNSVPLLVAFRHTLAQPYISRRAAKSANATASMRI
jgi:hypothetical protein